MDENKTNMNSHENFTFTDTDKKILDDAVNKILEAYYEIFYGKQQNNDYKKGDVNNE